MIYISIKVLLWRRFLVALRRTSQMTDAQLAMIQRHVLLPRASVADDIAGGVLWLASDLAAFVTGQIISIDGGICHHGPHYADMMDMFAAAQG